MAEAAPRAGRRTARAAAPRALGFVALCAAMVALLYRVGWPHYHAEERARIRAVLDAPDRVEVLVLGSSHAQAIDLEAMGLRGENLFMVAQDMFETAYGARVMAPRLPRLALVFVSVSNFTFLHDNGPFRRGGVRTRSVLRVKMYARYPISLDSIPGDASNALKGLLHPIVTEDHWRRVFEHPRWSAPPRPAPRPAEAPAPLELETVRREVAASTAARSHEEHARYAATRCGNDRVTNALMLEANPRVTEMVAATTRELIAGLRARGVRVVFFTPPYYVAYNEACDERWRQLMLDEMGRIARETGVEYYDFSRDPEFERDPRLFTNADHLNGRGARLFSARLREAMAARAPRP